ncbi:hypothetical protein NI461_13225 [Acinetobacter sp. S4400-12]|uniref:hypothetical protein n=1 Tax=Acinetobacter sp. S4400-12 TaxID=2953889 RepID=UPI00209B2E1F|nr:hypothetical protein [Acinetobacter sp. S4400-12]MCO8043586.1 hypothetical protein [Acinetobacter sp. S4400-12]
MINIFQSNLSKSIKYILSQKLIKILINLLVFLVLGIILEPEIYGIYSLHYAYALLGCAIVSGGLDELIMKKLLDSNPPTLLEMIFLKFIYLAIFILLTLAFFESLSEKFIYLVGVVFSIFIISHAKIESQAKGKNLSIYVILMTLFFSLIKIYFIGKVENQIYFLGLIFALENIFISFVPFLFLINRKENKINLMRFLECVKSCLPLWLSSVLFILSARVDYYLLNKYFDVSTLGTYSLVSRLIEQSYVLPNIIFSSMMVMIVYKSNNNQRNELYMYRMAFYGGLLLGILVFIFSSIILFVKNILDIYWYLIAFFLSLCIPFASLRVANSKFIIIDNMNSVYLKRTILTFLFSIIISTLMIDKFGVIGLSISVLMTIFFSSLLFDLISTDTRKYFKVKIAAISLLKE